MLRLKELRNKKKLSQSVIARQFGITQQAYANYERGARQPDFDTLNKLADYFNVSVDYLLGREEKTAPLEPSLTEKQQLILDLAEQLSDEDAKKLIDYAKLLKKANNQ